LLDQYCPHDRPLSRGWKYPVAALVFLLRWFDDVRTST